MQDVEQVLRQLSGTLGAGVKGVLAEGPSRSTTWSDKEFVMVDVFNPVPAADFVQVLVRQLCYCVERISTLRPEDREASQ